MAVDLEENGVEAPVGSETCPADGEQDQRADNDHSARRDHPSHHQFFTTSSPRPLYSGQPRWLQQLCYHLAACRRVSPACRRPHQKAIDHLR